MVQKYAHLAPEHLAEYADLLSSPKVVESYSRTLSGTPGVGDKKAATRQTDNCLILFGILARPEGFEPPTPWFVVIHLSWCSLLLFNAFYNLHCPIKPVYLA